MPQKKFVPGKISDRIPVEAVLTGKVWEGVVARLRVYDQPASTGKRVFAYLAPGHNDNYIGCSDDPNVIHALFLARDNARPISGYTNLVHHIEWLDY